MARLFIAYVMSSLVPHGTAGFIEPVVAALNLAIAPLSIIIRREHGGAAVSDEDMRARILILSKEAPGGQRKAGEDSDKDDVLAADATYATLHATVIALPPNLFDVSSTLVVLCEAEHPAGGPIQLTASKSRQIRMPSWDSLLVLRDQKLWPYQCSYAGLWGGLVRAGLSSLAACSLGGISG